MRVCSYTFVCSTVRKMFVMAAKDVSKKELEDISVRIDRQMEKWRSKELARDQKRRTEPIVQNESLEDDPGPSTKRRKIDGPPDVTTDPASSTTSTPHTGANTSYKITGTPDSYCHETFTSKAQNGYTNSNTRLSSDDQSHKVDIKRNVYFQPPLQSTSKLDTYPKISGYNDVSCKSHQESVGLGGSIHPSSRTVSNGQVDGPDEISDIVIHVDVDRKGRCNFDVLSSQTGSNLLDSRSSCTEVRRTIHSKTPGTNGNNSIDSNNKKETEEPSNKREYKSRVPQIFEPKPTALQCLPRPSIPDMSQIVALDCEFVGVGNKGSISALGRCSIVDFHGNVVCDVYARPEVQITDYRTRYSGLNRRNMSSAIPLQCALKQIAKLISGKIVVGHCVHFDFGVLQIPHPASHIRDTGKYKPLQYMMNRNNPGAEIFRQCSLKKLSASLLRRIIQVGQHCSVEDATATMDLYKLVWQQWETDLAEKPGSPCFLESSVSKRKKKNRNGQQNSFEESYLDDKFWPDVDN